jgi:hypothetical protein
MSEPYHDDGRVRLWQGDALAVLAGLPAASVDALITDPHKAERAYADALGCGWMNKTEARQAIPPAYTEWIGAQLHRGVRP